MTDNERKELKQKILESIEETKAAIVELQELVKPVAPSESIGRLTRMEAINSQSIHQAGLNQARQKLNKLERALKQVDDPKFGICLRCEQPIPIKRLMLMPEAVTCVRCAE